MFLARKMTNKYSNLYYINNFLRILAEPLFFFSFLMRLEMGIHVFQSSKLRISWDVFKY